MSLKEKALHFLTLFTASGTLICCAIPALLVTLGFGAVLAGVVAEVPGLVWLSAQKVWIFSFGGLLLLLGGVWQHYAQNLPCPVDRNAAVACTSARQLSKKIYWFSVAVYLIGFSFSFIFPRLMLS